MPTLKNVKEDQPSFENALEKLEVIVESMENGDLALEDLVSKFEEGDALLKYCNKRLKETELKIEKLKENGESQFEPFEGSRG